MPWNRTQLWMIRMGDRIEFLKEDHHIIGRDTPIANGLYVGAHAREILLVDPDSTLLKSYYSELVRDSPQQEQEILKKCFDYSRRLMTFDEGSVDLYLSVVKPDQIVSLDIFLLRRTGVCRHFALLNGYFLERMIQEERLDGKVSVGRNSYAFGAHAWCRYTSKKGVTVLDGAQNYFGDVHHGKWWYARNEDEGEGVGKAITRPMRAIKIDPIK